jgi:hypothetical protein
LKAIQLNGANVKKLFAAGSKAEGVGNSILAANPGAGDLYVPLPNVPAETGKRAALQDYLLMAYAWQSRELEVPVDPERATYGKGIPFVRRCCIASGVVEAIIAKVTGVIASPGLPDLPKGEIARLKNGFAQS